MRLADSLVCESPLFYPLSLLPPQSIPFISWRATLNNNNKILYFTRSTRGSPQHHHLRTSYTPTHTHTHTHTLCIILYYIPTRPFGGAFYFMGYTHTHTKMLPPQDNAIKWNIFSNFSRQKNRTGTLYVHMRWGTCGDTLFRFFSIRIFFNDDAFFVIFHLTPPTSYRVNITGTLNDVGNVHMHINTMYTIYIICALVHNRRWCTLNTAGNIFDQANKK